MIQYKGGTKSIQIMHNLFITCLPRTLDLTARRFEIYLIQMSINITNFLIQMQTNVAYKTTSHFVLHVHKLFPACIPPD